MHNGYKVVAFAVGNIIQTKMNISVNPFPEGNYLISKAHKLETHFLNGSERYNQLWNITNAFSVAHGE